MKKIAILLSLFSFVCFLALSTGYAQEQPKAAKETKTEQKATTADAAAGCAPAKDSKSCAKPCATPCTPKAGSKCCSDKKAAKCGTNEKELK